MRDKKKTLARIAHETDINALKAMWDKLHSLADIAALNDDARSWNDYCECEAACTRRIKQLKGESKMKHENKEDEGSPALDAAVAAKIAAHYHHAKTKHPYFADRLINFGDFGGSCKEAAEAVRMELQRCRRNLAGFAAYGRVPASMLVECESLEFMEALASGNNVAAVEECFDVIAVMLRIVDVMEGRQSLGRPKEGAAE